MNSPAETGVIRTYIETMLEMPWNKAAKDIMTLHLRNRCWKRIITA